MTRGQASNRMRFESLCVFDGNHTHTHNNNEWHIEKGVFMASLIVSQPSALKIIRSRSPAIHCTLLSPTQGKSWCLREGRHIVMVVFMYVLGDWARSVLLIAYLCDGYEGNHVPNHSRKGCRTMWLDRNAWKAIENSYNRSVHSLWSSVMYKCGKRRKLMHEPWETTKSLVSALPQYAVVRPQTQTHRSTQWIFKTY